MSKLDGRNEGNWDQVKNPEHYKHNPMGIECWDAMEAMMSNANLPPYEGNLWGNVFKYIWRWPYKEVPLKDLKKARQYLDRLIDRVEKRNNNV
jgi:hypothetical protein